MAKELKNLTKRSENYSKWYNELVVKADLAEQADVRGCMIIKPYGYAIWEKLQHELDKKFCSVCVEINRSKSSECRIIINCLVC